MSELCKSIASNYIITGCISIVIKKLFCHLSEILVKLGGDCILQFLWKWEKYNCSLVVHWEIISLPTYLLCIFSSTPLVAYKSIVDGDYNSPLFSSAYANGYSNANRLLLVSGRPPLEEILEAQKKSKVGNYADWKYMNFLL